MRVSRQASAEDWKANGAANTNDIAGGVVDYLETVNALMLAMTGRNRPADWCYNSMEDFLLRHGRFWTPRPLPSHIPQMTPKMCFENSFKLASRRKSLRYVEGIAVGVIPMHHAWCADEDGNVIDPTWASTQTELGDAYFGVAFDINTVRNIRHRECLAVLNNWKTGYKIFTQPFTAR